MLQQQQQQQQQLFEPRRKRVENNNYCLATKQVNWLLSSIARIFLTIYHS